MSSTNFTVPRGVRKIDCFCVGGGGGVVTGCDNNSSVGGGGGYTSTSLEQPFLEGIGNISIVVGAGGSTIMFSRNDGGKSSILETKAYNHLCQADGGTGTSATAEPWHGCDGGSGGAATFELFYGTGKGGVDGNRGASIIDSGFIRYYGGSGQGKTTRYFGESNGTLYSTGGCSAKITKFGLWEASAPGDGCTGGIDGGYPKSGICIIRWSEDYIK